MEDVKNLKVEIFEAKEAGRCYCRLARLYDPMSFPYFFLVVKDLGDWIGVHAIGKN